MAYRIKQPDSLDSEIRRIVLEETRGALRASRKRDAENEAVHAVRSHCKRVRALLRLVKPRLRKHYRNANHAFRNVARDLSDSRDAEVMRSTLESLLEDGSDELKPAAVDRLRARLARSNEDRRNGDRSLEGLSAAAESLKAAAASVDTWRIRAKSTAVLKTELGSSYRRGRRLFKKARKKQRPNDFHEWRKQVKHHWLQLKLLRPFSSKAYPGRMKRMAELARVLGDLHDLDVLEAWLDAQTDKRCARTARVLAADCAKRRSALRAQALTLGEPLFEHSRRAFIDKFHL